MAGVYRLIILLVILCVVCVELSQATKQQQNKQKKHAVKSHAVKTVKAKPAAKSAAKLVSHAKKHNQKPKRATTCKDSGNNCKSIMNQCADPGHVEIMKTNCAKTCGHCKRAANDCTNGYPDSKCREWNGQGFCSGPMTIEQKRSMCSKTCKLCEGGTGDTKNSKPKPGTKKADCKKKKFDKSCLRETCKATENKTNKSCVQFCKDNTNAAACKNNKPKADCAADKFKGDDCLKETCKNDQDAKNDACVKFCQEDKNKGQEACKKPANKPGDCSGDNAFKDECLSVSCKDKIKNNHPACVRFCADDENKKKEPACLCPNDPTHPKCIAETCKPKEKWTDSGCQDFCKDDKNKNEEACLCQKDPAHEKCLSETCKPPPAPAPGAPAPPAPAKDSACTKFCADPKKGEEDPSCMTDCTPGTGADRLKLGCIKSGKIDCTTSSTSTEKDDSVCKSFCNNPANKDEKACVDCTKDDNLHFHCLGVNCAKTPAAGPRATKPNKGDSACVAYCSKPENKADTTRCPP